MVLSLAAINLCLLISLIFTIYSRLHEQKKWRMTNQQLASSLESEKKEIDEYKNKYQSLIENTKELFVDPITLLPTYKVFYEQLQRAMSDSKRYSFYLALCLVEINNNQAFIDEDQDAKNIFLHECGEQLKLAIRKVDYLAHYTGNTFVILLTGLNHPEKAGLVAERIFDFLSRSTTSYNPQTKTVSIGISIYPKDADNEKEFFANTMHALAVAKQKGKSAYQFYDSQLQQQSKREHSLVNAMNDPKFFEQLEISYFPMINRQKKTTAMRAVFNWQHPTLGQISQAECVEFAQKQNRLIGLMVWQLEKACHFFLKKRRVHPDIAFLVLSMPLELLKNARFIHGLQQWLTKWNFPTNALCLQIYGDFQTIALADLEKSANMLQYLNIKVILEQNNRQGLPINYFAEVPFTYYKLDDKMLAGMLDSKKAAIVLPAISQFMQHLSIQLIVSDQAFALEQNILQQLDIALIEREQVAEAVH